jgi:hypothetical protein
MAALKRKNEAIGAIDERLRDDECERRLRLRQWDIQMGCFVAPLGLVDVAEGHSDESDDPGASPAETH